jgi:hypothetical protein
VVEFVLRVQNFPKLVHRFYKQFRIKTVSHSFCDVTSV